MLSAGGATTLTLLGCVDEVTLAVDSLAVARAGDVVRVPLLLTTPIDEAQPLEYSFVFVYDNTLMQYTGFDTDGSISEHIAVDVTPLGQDRLLVSAQRGTPAAGQGRLLTLLFRAVSLSQSARLDVAVETPLFAQSCNQRVELIGDHILYEGYCQPLVRFRGFTLAQNRPNPVTDGTTVISFRLPDAGTCRLDLYDAYGRSVATLVDGNMEGGEHAVTVRTVDLPAGVYYYRLSYAGHTLTRKLLLAR
jgi:hypothetical protein